MIIILIRFSYLSEIVQDSDRERDNDEEEEQCAA